jgi:hypothetical protein
VSPLNDQVRRRRRLAGRQVGGCIERLVHRRRLYYRVTGRSNVWHG